MRCSESEQRMQHLLDERQRFVQGEFRSPCLGESWRAGGPLPLCRAVCARCNAAAWGIFLKWIEPDKTIRWDPRLGDADGAGKWLPRDQLIYAILHNMFGDGDRRATDAKDNLAQCAGQLIKICAHIVRATKDRFQIGVAVRPGHGDNRFFALNVAHADDKDV